MRIRIVTYNIHKCQGFDRRVRPDRIIDVLQSIDADIICLQEVVDSNTSTPEFDQANEISSAFPRHTPNFGSNRALYGGQYGNMTLSRIPVAHAHNHSITHAQREPRGALHTTHATPSGNLHVFNVHLGTGFMERRHQAAALLSKQILGDENVSGPRIVLGDFNEWTKGLASVMLRKHFRTFQPRHAFGYTRTFPGMLPVLTLDFCFFEDPLRLIRGEVHRSPLALFASDHLPLVMDMELD